MMHTKNCVYVSFIHYLTKNKNKISDNITTLLTPSVIVIKVEQNSVLNGPKYEDSASNDIFKF